jgi:hypothetical protein
MGSRQLDNYTKALIPEPYVILGVELKPLCLGHIFLMKRFECGFADEDPAATGGIEDLFLGIAICSRKYEDFLEFIKDPVELKRWTKQWRKEILRQIKKSQNGYDLFTRIALFKKYLKDGIKVPKYWEQSEDDGISGTHWTHSVLNVMTSELGYSQEEAMNVPVTRALHDYFRFLERSGAITLMTDDELEIVEAAEEKDAHGRTD